MRWVLLGLLLGCGGETASQSEETTGDETVESLESEPEVDSGEPQVAQLLIVGTARIDEGAAEEAGQAMRDVAPRPEPVQVPTPAGTEAAPPGPRSPATATATAIYASLSAMSFEQSKTTSLQTAMAALIATIERGSEQVQALDRECAALVQANANSSAECATLQADARDLLAARMVGTTVPLPAELEAQLATLEADDRRAVENEVALQIRRVLQQRSVSVWCQAVTLYRRAGTARAQEQLARYGDEFVGTCSP